jgi:hypothetical protein
MPIVMPIGRPTRQPTPASSSVPETVPPGCRRPDGGNSWSSQIAVQRSPNSCTAVEERLIELEALLSEARSAGGTGISPTMA